MRLPVSESFELVGSYIYYGSERTGAPAAISRVTAGLSLPAISAAGGVREVVSRW